MKGSVREGMCIFELATSLVFSLWCHLQNWNENTKLHFSKRFFLKLLKASFIQCIVISKYQRLQNDTNTRQWKYLALSPNHTRCVSLKPTPTVFIIRRRFLNMKIMLTIICSIPVQMELLWLPHWQGTMTWPAWVHHRTTRCWGELSSDRVARCPSKR